MQPLISELQKRPTCVCHNVEAQTSFTHFHSVAPYRETQLSFVIQASVVLGHVPYTKMTVLQRLSWPRKVNLGLEEPACRPP